MIKYNIMKEKNNNIKNNYIKIIKSNIILLSNITIEIIQSIYKLQ